MISLWELLSEIDFGGRPCDLRRWGSTALLAFPLTSPFSPFHVSSFAILVMSRSIFSVCPLHNGMSLAFMAGHVPASPFVVSLSFVGLSFPHAPGF